jgi:hypothetical protein
MRIWRVNASYGTNSGDKAAYPCNVQHPRDRAGLYVPTIQRAEARERGDTQIASGIRLVPLPATGATLS